MTDNNWHHRPYQRHHIDQMIRSNRIYKKPFNLVPGKTFKFGLHLLRRFRISTCDGAFGITIVRSYTIFTNIIIIMVVNSPEIHIEPFRFFPTPKNQKSNMVFAHLSAGVFERWYRRYELLPCKFFHLNFT
uniref:Uncharacterized protein n=1 Tax=Wuchereria bancrofti TaxID=6293 RepID=A0A1I8ES34_WUCBA